MDGWRNSSFSHDLDIARCLEPRLTRAPACSLKERNRVTQKRYRDRQKSKLADSEERVAELQEQLSQLRTEKVGGMFK